MLGAARARGVGLVVIDTALHASDAALAAARADDLVLIPCRASVADLHAIGSSLNVCRVADVPGTMHVEFAAALGLKADMAELKRASGE